MKDSDIDYSDIPELDDSFFERATEAWPPAKQQVTIRLDTDVVRWLKAHGRGYQTRINRILRAVMDKQTSQQDQTTRPRPRTARKPRGPT